MKVTPALVRNCMSLAGLALLAAGLWAMHSPGLAMAVVGGVLVAVPIIGSIRK